MRPRRWAALAALAALSLVPAGAAGAAGAPSGTGPAPRLPLSDPANLGRWVPFAPMTDEFDGASLDPAKWHPAIEGWDGRPPALFAAHNAAVAEGRLALTLRREAVDARYEKLGFRGYTAGAVQSKTRTLYGYFEIRARAMPSAGASAFWLASKTAETWNEIDIAEMGGRAPADPRRLFTSLHVFRDAGKDAPLDNRAAERLRFSVSQGYHVYGADWDPRWIGFYLDGKLLRRVANTHWTHPASLILDAETQGAWFGMPDDADLPSTYLVDYVRVWKHAGGLPRP